MQQDLPNSSTDHEREGDSDSDRALTASGAPPVLPAEQVPHVDTSPSGIDTLAQGFRGLDPRFIVTERIAGWVFIAIVAGFGAIGLFVLLVITWPLVVIAALAALAYFMALGLLVWANQVLTVLSHRHASWRLNEQGLDVRRGIWWRHEITVPLARVQHTDVHQGPLLRKYGLAKLVIHTAGTQDAAIEVSGLSLETAEQLRDALVAQCEVKNGN